MKNPACLTLAMLAVTAAILASTSAAAPAKPPSADAIRQIIEESDPVTGGLATEADRERLAKLYKDNGYRLLWSSGGKPTAAALALLDQLRLAADRGLESGDYDAVRLSATQSALTAAPQAGPEQWALFDADVSMAGLRFVSDLHTGRIDPASVGHNLSMARAAFDVAGALQRIASASDVAAQLDAVEPPFSHYALLKKHLVRYRALSAREGLTDLPALPAKSLKPGDAYAGALKLQSLLVALGDAPAVPAGDPDPKTLTPPLVDGLKRFQFRHGEKADGTLGAATYAALTRPLKRRVQQIELTMERWRWLPTVDSAPIIVNIPQFRLFAFESTADSEAHIRQMDVIVGKSFDKTQTPVFAADMSYVIFRPYWEVPYSIAVKEIVPAARKNPNYIELHQMEIARGVGDGAVVMPNTAENVELVAKGALRLRQKPGPDNSLGLVKFMLPNPYNVYLHSTPAQSLFSQSRRDFSHGCVRVSDPVGLAEYVLRDSPDWTRDRILAAMNGDKPVTVTLKKKIRVFIVYGTALAREQGDVLFFDDIYKHDERLQKALDARRAARPEIP